MAKATQKIYMYIWLAELLADERAVGLIFVYLKDTGSEW